MAKLAVKVRLQILKLHRSVPSTRACRLCASQTRYWQKQVTSTKIHVSFTYICMDLAQIVKIHQQGHSRKPIDRSQRVCVRVHILYIIAPLSEHHPLKRSFFSTFCWRCLAWKTWTTDGSPQGRYTLPRGEGQPYIYVYKVNNRFARSIFERKRQIPPMSQSRRNWGRPHYDNFSTKIIHAAKKVLSLEGRILICQPHLQTWPSMQHNSKKINPRSDRLVVLILTERENGPLLG